VIAATARTPKVSICIPAYNQAQYLFIALRSALEQDFEDIEVVVSNNHSNDGTEEYLASVRDQRLRVVKPARHLNKAQHFDFCISSSSGQYINVLCSDDRLLPSYARKLAGVLDKYSSAAFAYSAAFIVEEERGARRIERHATGSFVRDGEAEMRRFIRNAGCVFPTIMMRRECYDRTGGFSSRCSSGRNWSEVIDWDLQLRLIRLGDIAYYDEPLAEFRVWESAEREKRPQRLIEETGWLYEAVNSEVVSARPELLGDFERAKWRRALNFACGVKKNETSEFQESKQLILQIDDSRSIRLVLLLRSLGLSPLLAAFLVWDRSLRRAAKATIFWCRNKVKPAMAAQ